MFTIKGIPDRNKVSESEWKLYIEAIANSIPTKEQKRNYDLMMLGEEIFHMSSDGDVRQVDCTSEEGQQVLNKFYDR